MTKSYTLRELELLANGNIPRQIALNLAFASCSADILAQINTAIDYIASEFARTPKERQDRSEDAISVDLVTSLKALGFYAGHDTTVGGHCDIVIDGFNNFLWLGEAKIHRSYPWLMEGFNQLDQRYATAGQDQDHGGIIIYCYGERVDQIMDRWEAYLREQRPDIEIEDREEGQLIINSKHKHRRNGRYYHVRHTPVSLFWNPTDK